MADGLTRHEAGARAALLDVDSYAVSLDLATDPGAVRSHAQVRFRCRRPGAGTFADLSAAAVSQMVLNGRRLDPDAAVAGRRVCLPGLAADDVLTVDAEFPRSRAGPGLLWFTDPADGAVYVLGSCFPADAPDVFCCFDQPDLRADFTLEVLAPAGWDCVANGAVVSRPPAGEAGVWRFATVDKMKPYELSLCAGPYVAVLAEEYRGLGGAVALSVRCRPALAGSAGLQAVGGLVGRVLASYERLLAVACPYPKYDIVFVPDLRWLAGSLPGVMTVSEELLRRMAGPGDDFVALVLAHEVGHLWFGCLVEGRWWDDLWLAEAVATYFSYTAGEEDLGLDSPWAEFVMREQAAAYRADSLPGTQPVSSPVAGTADALARPLAITYNKGASVIRQLAALIGDDALRTGFRDYLTRYGGTASTLDDLVGCWSRASGHDLSGWGDQWLRTAGVNTLRPELTLAPDGAIQSLAVIQEPPPAAIVQQPPSSAVTRPPGDGREPGPVARELREHRVTIGVYERDGARLRRRRQVSAHVTGARTVVPELAGTPVPDALIVNDGALTFARIRFDDRSFRALAACAMDVSDPLTEAVCWNAAWDMTTAAELSVAGFIDLVVRRIGASPPPPGLAELLARAVTAADYYAVPAERPGLRRRTAAAALDAARQAEPGSRAQRAFATGFAASADGDGQLGLLRSWLSAAPLPSGVRLDLELRAQILATLSAHGLATDGDLEAFAADDPAGGEAHRATCRARRPDPPAKEAAWMAALDRGQGPRMAWAHARGIWVPGQEDILARYRDRYFTEALPALRGREPRAAQELAELLFPATLAGPATIDDASAALARGDLDDALRTVLLEQRAVLQQVLAARAGAATG
ncbi:MAG TPA: aminopeptidase N [Streptosporangiaceae bacterium]|nr:aminopeptidase N [Streptosporangiaceae bacterium]